MNEVLTYINNQKAAGFNDVQIKQELLSAGHQEAAVAEYFSLSQQTEVRLHRIQNIGAATFLGGPLAGIYLITQNYLQLKKVKKAKIFALVSLSITFVIFVLIVAKIISANTFLFFISLWAVAEVLQGEQVKIHRHKGGSVHSIGKAIVVAFVALVSTFVVLITLILVYSSVVLQEDIWQSSTPTTDSQIPISSEESVEPKADLVIDDSNDTASWNEFTSEELQLSFSYPQEYGDVTVEYVLGAPAESPFSDEQCTINGEYTSTIACTGAIISFVAEPGPANQSNVNELNRQLMYVHGRYMSISPQGEWWGSLDINENSAPKPWIENPELLGAPNTRLYRTETSGDTRVQFATSSNPLISHIVIASPIQFGAYTEKTRNAFQNHIEQIPSPPAYEVSEAWAGAFDTYVQEVEMYDISDDLEIQKYMQMLKTISFNGVD